MTDTILYSDLSAYYDLMCADIDYLAQSNTAHRLQHIFGNQGKNLLDLGCGTGPHIRHFIDLGYHCQGLDLNQAMLDIAQRRCPEAQFSRQNMCDFTISESVDVISCFLYSIHYSGSIDNLKSCILSAYKALKPDGMLCFNAVDKNKIDNNSFTRHSAEQDGSQFIFSSRWYYCGKGEQQCLKLSIQKTTQNTQQLWQDEHTMVAVSFAELQNLLSPYFEVHIFEHDYEKLLPWNSKSGNAFFVCTKQ